MSDLPGLKPLRNLRLTLEYDGTDFNGSQLQPNGRTVQGELETALAKLTGLAVGQRCKVSLAGRTDSGVHATGQVASFQTDSLHSPTTFRRGLNALLPFDLAVLEAQEVSLDFHARFSAKSRHYRYSIINRPVRSPLARRFAHEVSQPLDIGAMQMGASKLIGEHDFASFAGAGWGVQATTGSWANHAENPDETEAGPSTVRRMLQAEWRQTDEGGLVFELAANAFLPHMVRNIVGTLLLVGKGERSVGDFEVILAAQDRRQAGPTAPACGLSLVKVEY